MSLNEFLTATAEILYGNEDDGAGRVEPSAAVESTPMGPIETQLLVAVSDSETDRSLEMESIDGDRSDSSSTEGGSRESSRTIVPLAVAAVGANGAGTAGAAGTASD
jgi:hypothetical protein